MAFTHDRAVDLAVAEIHRFVEVCRGADVSTPVPSCPGWDLAELLRHVGTVHRRAAQMVRENSTTRLRREHVQWDEPDDPRALVDWVAEGAAVVEASFRPADPAREMWAWGWPKNAGFWPRRMVHETGVHRADAELALGRVPTFDAEIAADGIDELLDNLPHAAYFAPKVEQLKGDGEVLLLQVPEASWVITLQPDGFGWFRDAMDADATLSARSPSDLLLVLYRRRQPVLGEISGDAMIVDRWLENSAL